MAWMPMYIDEEDLKLVLDWLNNEKEVAFILSNGPKRWIAKETVDHLDQGEYYLWHIPSGPLPLLGSPSEPDGIVQNPWAGWTEKITGANSWIPYFGPGHPGVILFSVRTLYYQNANCNDLSSFGWIGNHYRMIGQPAPEVTEKWWQRMKRWVKKNATRIPRMDPLASIDPEIWTFPSAYLKIKKACQET